MDQAVNGMVLIFFISLVVMFIRNKLGDKLSIFVLEIPIAILSYEVGLTEGSFLPSVIIFLGLQFWVLLFFVVSDMIAGND